ncbi:MAG: peptide chain release factor N(5)-glutamine methyltransferase [Proteiniphilum sp.]|nr:peptide chain release factor N(5)-glutamine methyltransferase [Proteiniphilum sp.]
MQQVIRQIRQELGEHYSFSEKSILARILLEEVSGRTFADITSGKSSNLSDSQRRKLEQILARLKKGEPFQYVLGRTSFYGLELLTGREALIPRPETEELVEWIIGDNAGKAPAILDMGTGSGCIAIALAVKIAHARVEAWELSTAAIQLAEENARRNGAVVRFVQRDILKPFPITTRFDLIVSNPPYVTESEKESMDYTVTAYEPAEALFVADSDPLLFYRRIASLADHLLNEGGRLYFEIHSSRGEEVCSMLHEKGFPEVELRKDLSSNDRMVRAVKH